MTALLSDPARERLYALLPAIYRIRDFEQGEPLRALLGILEEELIRIETDITGLYDNWFIETCDEWATPYIGGLVGARLLHAVSQRAFIANTLAYRRRKGTLQTLAAIARDVTSWPACAVEYRQLLAMTQQVNSARPNAITIPNLSQLDQVESLGTPFERTARTGSVRSRGCYHRDQVGLFVWRLSAYLLDRVRAVQAQAGCYSMNPLGHDCRLWSPAQSPPGMNVGLTVHNAPQPLRRTTLQRTLEARRQALADGRTPSDPYFDGEPVLRIFTVDSTGAVTQVPCEQILIAELDPWWTPPAKKTYYRSLDKQPMEMTISVALDPERGRLSFPSGAAPARVFTSYYYGFSSELGGGGYDRPLSPTPSTRAKQLQVSSGDTLGVLQHLGDPMQSGTLWDGAGGQLAIEITDSDTYTVGPITVPAGGQLELYATNWQRPLLTTAAAADGSPTDWQITLNQGATLIIEGLLCACALAVGGAGGSIVVRQATLVPGVRLNQDGSPAVPATASITSYTTGSLGVTLDKSITGGINLSHANPGRIVASDSVIDRAGSELPALEASTGQLSRVTVLGGTNVQTLDQAIDTLFCASVLSSQTLAGNVRYCYLPGGSSVAGPYRCQPSMYFSTLGGDWAQAAVRAVPWFVSRRYDTPGYAMLDPRCHPVIRNGASVEGEFGALLSLQQAQREANLLDCQAEYLRVGISMNLFLVT